MSNNPFKARALYDFTAEGSNELSFRTNDILTITSTTAGHGWWYAKDSSGKVGVIPENYVQTLADPPEPNEPPPPPLLSTFSNTSTNNTYLNNDFFGSSSTVPKISTPTFTPTSYDPPLYMNPIPTASSAYNTWQTHDSPSSLTATSRTSVKRDTDSDDSFSDPEYPSPSPQPTSSNMLSKPPSIKSTTTLTPAQPVSNSSRTSMTSGEVTRAAPKARFFDKHGLDNYLLNGCKTEAERKVEITFIEREGGVCWAINQSKPPFTCKVEDPSKGTKLGGLKAFTEYKILPQIPGSRHVCRRYKQFDWLHEQLVSIFRFICIPPLPGKQIAGRFEQEFVQERRRQLEIWLNRICRHPVLCASYVVQHFITCETTDKNRKEWKKGKRTIEKEDLREASWLHSVVLTSTGVSESEIASQIETFAQQQPALESQLKNLSQGLTKYLERYTEVYERDTQRVSELFSKVHQAVQMDTVTRGNKELSTSISKISESYSNVADLYKGKASEGLRDFNERVQEYIGLVACFPSILSIQRSASEFMKTAQQRAPPDFSNAIHRNHILNHVVLAEINFFQKEKVADLKQYMKTFVDDQSQFYSKVSVALHDASQTFQ